MLANDNLPSRPRLDRFKYPPEITFILGPQKIRHFTCLEVVYESWII
jgi:hypothetical protein